MLLLRWDVIAYPFPNSGAGWAILSKVSKSDPETNVIWQQNVNITPNTYILIQKQCG